MYIVLILISLVSVPGQLKGSYASLLWRNPKDHRQGIERVTWPSIVSSRDVITNLDRSSSFPLHWSVCVTNFERSNHVVLK